MVTEIICIDPRMRGYQEGQVQTYGEALIVLKNAGANAWGFERSLQALKDDGLLDEIVVVQHTECAAVGLIYRALKGEVKLSESLSGWPPFARLKGLQFSGEQQLQAAYTKAQVEWLEEKFGVKVTVKAADMKKLGLSGAHYPQAERELLVAHATHASTSEIIAAVGNVHPEKTYVATARVLEDIIPDIEIAVTHIGTNKVTLAANGDAENAEMQSLKGRIDSSLFVKDATTAVVPIREKSKSRR